MKRALIGASVALVLTTGPAVPQAVPQLPVASLRCSDIASADPAYQAALVYYAAGYRDGLDYAMALNNAVSSAAPPASAMASAEASAIAPVPSAPSAASVASVPPASSASAEASPGNPGGATIIGGLSLQADAVIAACAASPDALVTDLVANRGGGQGFAGTPGGTTPGAATTTTTSTSAPNPAGTTSANPAPDGAVTGTAASALNGDLQGASQQLQQNIASGTPPAPAASAAAAGASSP